MLFVLIFLVFSISSVCGQKTCSVTIQGCYTDFTINNTRTLVMGPYSPVAGNSLESCAAICSIFGTKYSGVEYGSQCFCGDSLNPASGAKQVGLSECQSMACPGNSSEWCGASDRLLLYTYQCTGKLIPSYQACTDALSQSFPYCNTDLSHTDRVEDLIQRLSLDEKIAMLSPQPELGNTCGVHTAGKASIGLPNYFWLVETNTGVASSCFGPDRCVTTFSGPLGMAASFNRTNWELKGRVMGFEMRAFNNAQWPRGTDPKDFIGLTGYGPNINIARDPRFGRTSELPGEDPYLNGQYAKHMVTGMQTEDSQGHPLMLAYLKHFTAYSRETSRGSDTYNISMHDLFETYLAQYQIAFVEGKATGAMCSYNGINGVPSCSNGFLLNDVIRRRWNRPDAHITTDCGAVENMRGYPAKAPSDPVAAAWTINNGTDLEMGSEVWTNFMKVAVVVGLVSEGKINQVLRRSYLPQFRAGRFDPLFMVEWSEIGAEVVNSSKHQQIQFDAALQSFVLLKNDRNILPLKKGSNVAVLGPMGVTRFGMLSDYAGDQICWDNVGYSCIPTIAEGIARANFKGTTTSAPGVDINSPNASGIPAALQLANSADIVVLVLGIDRSIEHEGVDREDTALPGLQEIFAQAVLALDKPTILIFCNGGAIAFDDLVDGPLAIIEAYNPSVAGPVALGATIFGDYNKWGKLVTTLYPHSFISQNPMTNYDMALPPGRTYKYYTGTPLFPFGHGLSYTTFDLACAQSSVTPTKFTCNVSNTGTVDGDEVVLVYHNVSAAIRSIAKHPIPLKSLVNFERVHVPAGETVQVEFYLFDTALSLINENGEPTLYPGVHQFIFSRGHGSDVVINVVV